MNAVEAASRSEGRPAARSLSFTMGPPPAEGMLRELIAMGADEGVLVSAREFGGSDTYAPPRSSPLPSTPWHRQGRHRLLRPSGHRRRYRTGRPPDCGEAAPAPGHLCPTSQKDGDTLTVKRMLEDGYMTIKVNTPCLITCIKELNTPRYMSVSGVFECYSKPVVVRLQCPEGSSPD